MEVSGSEYGDGLKDGEEGRKERNSPDDEYR